ncbi:hypothetical protein GCM10010346_63460 [Streptomyces chryseus]|uniref:Uncharacterized protein n=1 Tax=Streptomyces chryseus TaxID=68186 RepID=A0ABQ3EHZ8_9ACTN|nr:hypothetical protein GCM10010346_63460 [Streptomyces chryseus]
MPPAETSAGPASSTRAAISEARRAAVVLAQRVRDAHRGRVWVALGHSGWSEYAQAELEISRAQAYRLIDIPESAEGLSRAIGAVGVLAEVSPAGDTEDGALVDLGLSQRALREVHSRPTTSPLSSLSGSPQRPGPARSSGRRSAPSWASRRRAPPSPAACTQVHRR